MSVTAFLIIWSLDPSSGAGTVTMTPQPTYEACIRAAAARPDTSATGDCVTLETIGSRGYALASARCAPVTETAERAVWVCKGRRQ